MTDGYTAEQADDGTGMDADLIPWLERSRDVDLTLSEFPYFHYLGPDDSEEIRKWLDSYGCTDIWTLPDHLRESSAYRTDLVAVRVDERALDRREREVGHHRPLIGREGWGREQPNLRAWLNFRRDGPMTREFYIQDHGIHGEPNGQPPEVSERTFSWLADHGFLTETPGGEYRAADIQPVFAAVHAVELKRVPSEWDTALEQADRADVYADFRWTCFSEGTANRALANTDAFRERGVGLMTVSSSTGSVTVHVEPERVSPSEDHSLLSRPYCERWDLNERVLKRWTD
jgi:hypothetical protein